MCGLFAIVPTIDVDEALAIKLRFLAQTLAKENDSRGGHSWGLWSYDYNPMRGLGDIAIDGLRDMQRFLESWTPKKHGWMAGHTRFGTHGGHTVANAHPFTVGHLTLAHNGIVDVDFRDHDVQKHPVDSGQLAIAISKYGLKEALAKTTGLIGLLFSMKDNKLMAYRSAQVLHYAKCPWGYVVSSDKYHLAVALDWMGMEGDLYEFESNVVSAPWYSDFVPYKAFSGGRYQITTFIPPITRSERKRGKWDRATMDKEGAWSYPERLGKGGFKLEPDTAVKLTRAAIEALEGPSLSDAIEELERPIPAKGYDDTPGRYGAPKVVKHALYDFDITYQVGGRCHNCQGTLDQEGGFFFDEGDPTVHANRNIACCSKCLEEKAASGLLV